LQEAPLASSQAFTLLNSKQAQQSRLSPYFQGAKVTRVATLKIPAGENTLEISDLPIQLIQSSSG
jgi:hypothetical protein